LEFSLILIEQEMNHSKRLGDTNNAMNRAQRKLSSVQSLKVLAVLISEVEWS
jgi:hypothetical protein